MSLTGLSRCHSCIPHFHPLEGVGGGRGEGREREGRRREGGEKKGGREGGEKRGREEGERGEERERRGEGELKYTRRPGKGSYALIILATQLNRNCCTKSVMVSAMSHMKYPP